MRWSVWVTTCEREAPTLSTTLQSLAKAGWPEVGVLVDSEKSGSRNAFLRTCELAINSMAPRILLVQDDVLFAPGLREHLERQAAHRDGVVSLWLPEAHEDHLDWWRLNDDDLPRRAYGALAYVLDPLTALDIHLMGNYNGQPNKTDYFVGHACKQLDIPYWYPPRSYCQHFGQQSTISPGIPFLKKFRKALPGWDKL